MDDSKSYVRDGFLRQRRNLMIMSIVVLVQEYAGLEYHVISALGNEAPVDNEFVMRLLVYLMFGYWLIRYFQYMGDLSDNEYSKIFSERWLANVSTTQNFKEQMREQSEALPDPENIRLVNVGRIGLQLQYFHLDDEFPAGARTHLYTFPVIFSLFTSLLTHISLFTTTRFFTEYYFPYLLALLATLSIFVTP